MFWLLDLMNLKQNLHITIITHITLSFCLFWPAPRPFQAMEIVVLSTKKSSRWNAQRVPSSRETTQNLNALDRPPGWPGIQIRNGSKMGSEFFREFLWLNYFDIFDILWSPGGNHGGKIVDFCFSNLPIFLRSYLENLRDLDALIIVGNLLRMTSHPPAR